VFHKLTIAEIKNRSFLDSKFTQFVYMDSDNIPLADPADLFESVEFKQSGSVFWPDLNKDHRELRSESGKQICCLHQQPTTRVSTSLFCTCPTI
jgi:hypothetical protein